MFTIQNSTRNNIREAWLAVKKLEQSIKDGNRNNIASNAAEALRRVNSAVVLFAVTRTYGNCPIHFNELAIINGIAYATAGVEVEKTIKNAKYELIRMMRATKYLAE